MIDIYSEIILDHYKNPRNYGRMKDADFSFSDSNPLCGDVIQFFVKLDGRKIKDVKFNADGCAISIASASMISEWMIGKNLNEIVKLDGKFVMNLFKVELSPIRMKCALLPLNAVRNGLMDFEKR